MFGAMPKEWVLTFEYKGGKVTTVVIARTDVGAKAFAPSDATNVTVRRKTRVASELKGA